MQSRQQSLHASNAKHKSDVALVPERSYTKTCQKAILSSLLEVIVFIIRFTTQKQEQNSDGGSYKKKKGPSPFLIPVVC